MKILKFYADWCGPCKQLSKLLDRLKEEHTDIEIIPINVEEEEELTSKYGIHNVPVLVKLNDDEVEIDRSLGAISFDKLKEFIL
jgi:thioredoxin 1